MSHLFCSIFEEKRENELYLVVPGESEVLVSYYIIYL